MRKIFITVSGSLFLGLSLGAAAQDIWFSPMDHLQRGGKPAINQDFPRLFDTSPSWSVQTDVFEISPLMGSIEGPEEMLHHMSSFLRQHHIALAVTVFAVEMDAVNRTSGECGFGIEGYIRPGRNAIYFKRLKELGIEIQYVVMDSPLTFGHYYDKKNACRYSMEDTMRRVAAAIAEIRQFYPDVKVVDIEAPNVTSPEQWKADFPGWLAAYRQATGSPLYGVAFDIDWPPRWLEWVNPSTMIGHKNDVRVGIIIDGTGPGASDADSIMARKNNTASVDQAKLPLDFVIIANWTPHPSRNLPESDPDSLTNFLRWYEDRHGQTKRGAD